MSFSLSQLAQVTTDGHRQRVEECTYDITRHRERCLADRKKKLEDALNKVGTTLSVIQDCLPSGDEQDRLNKAKTSIFNAKSSLPELARGILHSSDGTGTKKANRALIEPVDEARKALEQVSARPKDIIYKAMNSKKPSAIRSLIDGGMDINSTFSKIKEDLNGYTPLTYAIKRWSSTSGLVPLVIRYLVQISKADVNQMDEDTTPLILALKKSDIEVIKYLLENGADPNKLDYYRRLPAQYAILNKQTDILKLLLENGADPDLQGNNNGQQHSLKEIAALMTPINMDAFHLLMQYSKAKKAKQAVPTS